MADLLIRGLDEKVVGQLKTRAKKNGRSLQAEIKGILENAAPILDAAAARRLVRKIREAMGDRIKTNSTELLRQERDR